MNQKEMEDLEVALAELQVLLRLKDNVVFSARAFWREFCMIRSSVKRRSTPPRTDIA